MSDFVPCNKNRSQCSKKNGHRGRCNHEKKLIFWKSSPVVLKKELKHLKAAKDNIESESFEAALELAHVKHQVVVAKNDFVSIEKSIEKAENQSENINQQQNADLISLSLDRDEIKEDIKSATEQKEKNEEESKELQQQYNKFKLLVSQKGYAVKRRQNNQTTHEMVNSNSTTRYRRRNETKDLLEFVHGGENAAIYGAWDFLSKHCDENLLQSFIMNYKRGKFLQEVYSKVSENCDETKLRKAIATKYLAHLSRRKYNLLSKIQETTFGNTESKNVDELLPKNDEFKLDLRTKQLSHYSVDKFVKSLDIGEVHQIPGCAGLTRTITALITMVADVNLKVPTNKSKLVWFNGNENHFIVEFSDDGAPESKEETMTIGSLTLWNFENRVRSRDYHYPLHLLSVQEKDQICSDLWHQHCDEMQLIESNVFNINSQKVTFEFHPSADQSWQCWAANVLPSSATYPSPYGNVHKSELAVIGGTIGFKETDTWIPPTTELRAREIEALENFRRTKTPNVTDNTFHKKELQFMAKEGFRQIGIPRIGIFADRLRPEPLHLEINNWHHVLTIIYLEAVRRGRYQDFITILRSPISCSDKPGCGLNFVGKLIEEQYSVENKRMNSLEVRLIGSQAITLAQYSHRLVDTIQLENSSKAEEIKHHALSLICCQLRDIGGLMNKVTVNKSYPDDLNGLCTTYFNLFALYFPEKCQSTVWTLGYAVPYHARKLYENFQAGYGILSMQGKESLHSSLKQQLRNETNRSTVANETGKWHQIMRASYFRNFYLPYHFSLPPTYHSHYQARRATYDDGNLHCMCSRKLEHESDGVCVICHDSSAVLESAKSGTLPSSILKALKPMECSLCRERFADTLVMDHHYKLHHSGQSVRDSKVAIPSKMTVLELKAELKKMNKSTTGSKETLRRRLEGLL